MLYKSSRLNGVASIMSAPYYIEQSTSPRCKSVLRPPVHFRFNSYVRCCQKNLPLHPPRGLHLPNCRTHHTSYTYSNPVPDLTTELLQ
eukprot:scaffold3926_cov126-Skeletonema_menzelii.AAC.6